MRAQSEILEDIHRYDLSLAIFSKLLFFFLFLNSWQQSRDLEWLGGVGDGET